MTCLELQHAFKHGPGIVLQTGPTTGSAVQAGVNTLLSRGHLQSGQAWRADSIDAFRCAAPRNANIQKRTDGGCGAPKTWRRPYMLLAAIGVTFVLASVLCSATSQPIWAAYVPTVAAATAAAVVVAWTIHSYWAETWLGEMHSCRETASCVGDAMRESEKLYGCPSTKIDKSYWLWSTVVGLAAGWTAFFVTMRLRVPYAGRTIAVIASSVVMVAVVGRIARQSWNPFLPNCAATEVVIKKNPTPGVPFTYNDNGGSGLRVAVDGDRVTGLSCEKS